MDTFVCDDVSLAEVVGGLKAGALLPFLGSAVAALDAANAGLPLGADALVARLSKKVPIPGRLRNNLTAAAQYIETFRHRKVLRAAMGAHFALNLLEGADLAMWLGRFKGQSIALDGSAQKSLYDLELRGKTALLVGNEGAGLSAGLREAASVRAKIPISKRMESLNAAAAGTVALFEAARQRALE